MVGLEEVIDLVTIALWSGQVEGERPLSMILVAPPGTGKTTVLEMIESETSHFLSDFTSREVRTAMREKKEMTHLLLGDFLALFGHAKGTVKLSVNLLSRMTGDTIRQQPWTGEEMAPRRMGFLTAIPPDDLAKREIRMALRSGGFASRFIIAKYAYTQATIERIHKFIREGKYRRQKPFQVLVKPGAFLIEVPLKIAYSIDTLARQIKNDPIGFRAHHHLRTLACSIARMRGSNTVEAKDYEKLLGFCDFFSENGKKI